MKRVVVKVNNKKAIVLNSEGIFEEVKNKGYVVGQRIPDGLENRGKVMFLRRLAGIAVAACLLIAIVTGGAYTYNKPTTVLSVDINPSIEIVANTFNKVIDFDAINKDAEGVLANVDIKGKEIEDAVQSIVEEATEQGFISNEKNNPVLIAVASEEQDKSEKIRSDVRSVVERVLEERAQDAEVISDNVDLSKVEEAHNLGITAGKLNIVQKYVATIDEPENVDIEEWINAPVKDVISAINSNKEIVKAQEKAQKEIVKEQEKLAKEQEKTEKEKEKIQSQIEKEKIKEKVNDQKIKGLEKEKERLEEQQKQIEEAKARQAEEAAKIEEKAQKEKKKTENELAEAQKKAADERAKAQKKDADESAKNQDILKTKQEQEETKLKEKAQQEIEKIQKEITNEQDNTEKEYSKQLKNLELNMTRVQSQIDNEKNKKKPNEERIRALENEKVRLVNQQAQIDESKQRRLAEVDKLNVKIDEINKNLRDELARLQVEYDNQLRNDNNK